MHRKSRRIVVAGILSFIVLLFGAYAKYCGLLDYNIWWPFRWRNVKLNTLLIALGIGGLFAVVYSLMKRTK